MKKTKNDDMGGNNFLLSVAFIFVISGLFVGIDTEVVEIINLKEILNFEINHFYFIVPILIGCIFFIWAFKKK